MRRLSLTLLVALLALPAAAFAARNDKGDGSFELKGGNGVFAFSGHGVLLAQIDKGTLRVTDVNPNDNLQAAISGADHTRATDDPNTMVYSGTNIHVRVTGGPYRLRFKGSGLDLTAVGVGIADLTGSALSLDPGSWSLDGGTWTSVPYLLRAVPFGTQPPAATNAGP